MFTCFQRLAPLAVALALAGCGGEPAPATAPDGTASELVMGPEGLGRLGAQTPFDTAAVRAALPAGFAVELRSGETGPVIWALRDGLLVLEVYGDDGRVDRIDAASDQIEGPEGARTGQSFADVNGADMRCQAGDRDLAGRVACGRGPVRYVFAHAGADPLPDDDQLADALLERIVWTAD